MPVPSIVQGKSLTRLLQGAVLGAITTLIIGFYWGGWVTGGTAREMAQKRGNAAIATELAPICVDKFRASTKAATNLSEGLSPRLGLLPGLRAFGTSIRATQ
jgi:hypothetical protein